MTDFRWLCAAAIAFYGALICAIEAVVHENWFAAIGGGLMMILTAGVVVAWMDGDDPKGR